MLDDAFLNCSSLTRVDITVLSAYLKISFNRGSSNPLYYAKNIYLNGELLTDLVIPEDITEIKVNSFYNATCLKAITIHSDVTKIADAFIGCAQLMGIYITDISAWMNIDFGPNPPLFYAKNLYLNNVLLTELTVPDTFTEIKGKVSYGAACLKKVIIPEGVTTIGGDAFNNCDNLESISIPNSLTSIACGSFYACNKLKGNLYDNAYYLGNENNPYLLLLKAIKATSNSITSCEIHKDTKFIIDEAFLSTKITSLTIPESVTTIGSYAFAYSAITSIVIPDTVTNLGGGMFRDCTKLQSVTLSNKMTEIGMHFFNGCSMFTSVVIPDSVTEIQYYAFKSCTNLTSVTIEKKVTKIWSSAFYGCTALKSVVIPDSVTAIYGDAFGNCTELTSITFGNGLTSISAYAFDGCSKLTEIVIPESYTTIGFRAFAKCTGLTTVTIHAGVTNFNNYMFESCGSLTTINYQGTFAQWKKIVKVSSCKSGTGEFTVICTDGEISKEDA